MSICRAQLCKHLYCM